MITPNGLSPQRPKARHQRAGGTLSRRSAAPLSTSARVTAADRGRLTPEGNVQQQGPGQEQDRDPHSQRLQDVARLPGAHGGDGGDPASPSTGAVAVADEQDRPPVRAWPCPALTLAIVHPSAVAAAHGRDN